MFETQIKRQEIDNPERKNKERKTDRQTNRHSLPFFQILCFAFSQVEEGFPKNITELYRCSDDTASVEDEASDSNDNDVEAALNVDVATDLSNTDLSDNEVEASDTETSDSDEDSDEDGREIEPPEGRNNSTESSDESEELTTPLICSFWPKVQAATVMGDGLTYAFFGKS